MVKAQKNRKTISSPFMFYARGWFESRTRIESRSKIKAVIISLVLGIILAFIVMTIATKQNPFTVFTGMFSTAFGGATFDYTLALTGLLIASGVANAIAFRTGLFNIGVGGQMFFSGALSVMLGLTLFKNYGALGLIILVWIGAFMGGIIAGFAGFLKAKFNVHEVVSTIMLNWGLFYIARWIIKLMPGQLDGSGGTLVLPIEFQLSSFHYGLIIFLASTVIALIIAVLLWKTTFGYAMKATGSSKTAAEYAGININKQIIISMFLSGAIAGILGVMTFVIQDRQVGSAYLNFANLPQIGFEGIALALLGFSNPIAIIPLGFFFAIFESGTGGLSQFGIDSSFGNLIVGIVMYFAAITILFIRFRPIEMVYTWAKINKKKLPDEFGKIGKDYEAMKNSYTESLITKPVSEKEAKLAYKNIKRHRKTQIALLKQEHLQQYYKDTHWYRTIQISEEFKKIELKRDQDLEAAKLELKKSNNKEAHKESIEKINKNFQQDLVKVQDNFVEKKEV